MHSDHLKSGDISILTIGILMRFCLGAGDSVTEMTSCCQWTLLGKN